VHPERSSGTRAAQGGCHGAHSRRRAARQALAYRRRVLDALPAASGFQPLMTLYLTDRTPPDEVRRAREAGVVAFKLYPAGATTNSESGVTDIGLCLPTLRAIAQAGDPGARPCPGVKRSLFCPRSATSLHPVDSDSGGVAATGRAEAGPARRAGGPAAARARRGDRPGG